MADLLRHWQERHVSQKEPKTRAFYGHMVKKIFPVLGRVKVADLAPAHVETPLAAYRGKASAVTLAGLHNTMRAAWNRGKRWRLVTGENPCAGVDPPKLDREARRPLEPDEARRLLETARGDRLFALLMVALTTGLRQGELLGLTWADVDLDRGVITVRRSLEGVRGGEPVFGDAKTRASVRSVPIGPAVVEALREHQGRQQVLERIEAGSRWRDLGLVFTAGQGSPVMATNLRRRWWRPLLRRAGLREDLHFHDLRHTFATLALSEGRDLSGVSEVLGHADKRTMLTMYVHGRDTKKREAVSALEKLLTAPSPNENGG